MKPTDIIKQLTLEEIQTLRRMSRHPQFREKCAGLVEMFKASRDDVLDFTNKRRAELIEAEKALQIATRKVEEAEAILAEVQL
jgi:hypothetical protein